MISPETRVQIRRYFYAEHWKIGTIARELNVHPDAVRNAIESDRFNRTAADARLDHRPLYGVRSSDAGPASAAARHTHSPDDPRPRLQRQHRAVAARRGPIAPAAREPFLKLQAFPAEQAQVDWAHFGHVAGGPRPAHIVLLRGHAVVVAGAVSGVLLRPDDGELPARPRACL